MRLAVLAAVLVAGLLSGCRTQCHVQQRALLAVCVVYSGDYEAGKRVDPATDLSLPLVP